MRALKSEIIKERSFKIFNELAVEVERN